ncbi:MAG: type transport system permease protein, partial [Pseudonocardiales bacterium]|nr:type transport system permease protein [Pseudonocardiales bacterium]
MTTTGVTERGVPGVAAAGLHRVRVELLQFWRSGEAVFFTLGFPPIMLVLFGAIFGSNQIGPRGTSVTFSQYFTAGMIGTGVWTSCFQVLAI